MNNVRYKDECYETRPVSDLRELMNSGAELYGDRAAYLVKSALSGGFAPVSFRRFRADVTALGAALLDAGYLEQDVARQQNAETVLAFRCGEQQDAGTSACVQRASSVIARSETAQAPTKQSMGTPPAPLERSKVALISENRYEYVVAYFAIVCGGGVAVPIDPRLPAGDVAALLRRAGATAVFHSRKYESALNGEEAPRHATAGHGDSPCVPRDAGTVPVSCARILMEEISSLIARGKELIRGGDDRFFHIDIDPREMCALLFTSGTTGAAKGVMLSHANLMSNVRGMSAFINAGGMVALSVLPMHHTLEFTCDILTALYQGCTVAICEGLRYIKRDLASAGAQVVIGVPLVFEKMHRSIMKTAEREGKYELLRGMIDFAKLTGESALTKPLFRSVRRALGGRVKLFLVGGAPCDPAVISDFNAMGIRMIQGYGMTETSPIISVGKDRYSKDASVGMPLHGSFVQIDDADADGVGEIVIAGPSVMLGYYDDESATKAAMPDGRLRTGDLGRFDDEGFLSVTGRVKNVIVLKNGKNVYPEEVEQRLLKSPYIEEVVVSGAAGGEGRQDVVVRAEIFPDADAVRRDFGDMSADDLHKIIEHEVDRANASLPPHARVLRVTLRSEPFDKTTTKKIKRPTER